jgi:hypothetical protein
MHKMTKSAGDVGDRSSELEGGQEVQDQKISKTWRAEGAGARGTK